MSTKKEKARLVVAKIAKQRGVHVGIAKTIYLCMSRKRQQQMRASL